MFAAKIAASRAARYGFALAVPLAAFALRLSLSRYFGSGLTYITFSPAVMLAATLGGFIPGLLATAVSAVLAGVWILPPEGKFQIADSTHIIGLAVFVGMGVFMSAVAGLYHKARAKLADYEKVRAKHASDERLALFVEHAPAAIAMFDTGMRYLAASRRWLIDYDIVDLDVIGRCHYDVFPDLPERWKEIHQRCLRGCVERADEDPFPRLDGTLDWVRWEIHPWYDMNGAVGGLLLLSEVITARKHAEEALRRYELLAANSRDIILFMNRSDGRILEANQAALQTYGYSHEELLRLSIFEIRAPNTQALTPEQMASADEKGVLFETYHRRRDGSVFPVEVSSRGATMGDVRALVSIVRDITERKDAEERQSRMQEALLEADRNKNEFLAILSHELRNPLAPIVNSLHVLNQVTHDSDPGERARTVITRQVNQLTRLVDDLLDVTRISRKKIQLLRKRVDTNELLRQCAEDHRVIFERSQVQLELILPIEPQFVHGDAARIAQVLGNLLHNARKFTPQGGLVTISVGPDTVARDVIFRVKDNGIGLSNSSLSRLFEPFMQVDRTIAMSKGGLGLGLALAKGLVELHGGTLSVYSDGLGRGAEFTVRLPQDDTITPELPLHNPATVRKSRRVLIIEDNVDAAESLRDALELGDHRVQVAHEGPGGIAKAREFRPEVVLCDIGLPGMDGYAVAREIRADETLKDVLLVALTGYTQTEDLKRASEAGFERHLAKPPSLEQLEELLASAGP